ncbi:MAG: carbon-nitrogen hydrolase family protein [Verrucomicrobiota bacterium]
MKLATAQILGAKDRVMARHKDNPVARNDHFKKYNISASTYDEAYCRAYAEEYLGYLEEQVRGVKADLLLFPEFCFTPGVLSSVHPTIPLNPNARADALKLYTWSGQLFTKWLRRQAKQAGMFLAAASFTIRAGKIYNTGLLADEAGNLALRYEKIHLPIDEKQSVEFGRRYNYADTRLGRIAFAICYDIQYPEHTACLATQGIQIILHPSGGYTLPGEAADMGQQRLRVRASDCNAALVYTCFANDQGCSDSCVIAPNGDVKACVPGKEVGIAIGEVTVGKRMWPNDKPEDPDREIQRRDHRRPQTYRPLIAL